MKKESRHVWALLLAAALTPAGMITSLAGLQPDHFQCDNSN